MLGGFSVPSGQDIQNLIERFDAASASLEATEIQRIHQAMDDAFRALSRQLSTIYPELQSIGGLVAAQQKFLILQQLGDLLQILKPGDAAQYEQAMQGLLQQGFDLGGELAGSILAEYDTSLDAFANIPIEAVANAASESVKRLYRYSDEFSDRAATLTGQALIQGWGFKKLKAAMQAELGISKGKAETLARTEMMSALNQGSLARYAANGIDLVQWNISPSEGLCGRCSARNQRVYRRSEVYYPIHPRCRCFLSPVRESWLENGLFDKAFAAQYRQQGFDQLKKNGLKPDYSLSGFERKAGLTEVPEPVWSP